MLAILLLVLGIVSRLIVHVPNFTPVVAIALFGGAYFPRKYAIILPLALLMISDLFLGLHNTMFFTWLSIIAVACVGLRLQHNKSTGSILFSSLMSAFIFFVVSNFGVWIVGGLYSLTAAGLVECFTAAIPFFRYTLISTLAYSAVFFGIYEFVSFRVKGTSLARVLLTS